MNAMALYTHTHKHTPGGAAVRERSRRHRTLGKHTSLGTPRTVTANAREIRYNFFYYAPLDLRRSVQSDPWSGGGGDRFQDPCIAAGVHGILRTC